MQEIQDLLQGILEYGGGDWEDLYNLSGAGLASGASHLYGYEYDPDQAGLFTPPGARSIKAAEHKTYAPMIHGAGALQTSTLAESLSGKKAMQAAGNFAGSTGYNLYQSKAKDVFGKKMGDILKTKSELQSAGIKNLQDTFAQYYGTGSGLSDTLG